MKKKTELNNEIKEIVHTISTTKILIGAFSSVVIMTLATYGFFQKQKNDLSNIVNTAVLPIKEEQIIIKQDIRNLSNQIKTEDVKSTTVIKYINDPALTKQINDNTEIIRKFTEEVKKNGMSSELKIQSKGTDSQE
jgi:hypothetical protein